MREQDNFRIVKENQKRSKGITLVALVIAIIIIIILSTITINMAFGDNGLIERAQEAAEQTKQATENEQICMNKMEDYITNILNEESEKGTIDRSGLMPGDYINYEPEQTTDYTKLNEANTGASENSMPIKQDKLNWQILRVYDDGRIDLIGSATNQDIYFQGVLGYNNGVYLMNDICESLYSRGDIKARSIAYEDVEYWLTDEGKKERDNYIHAPSGVEYTGIKTYKTNSYYPNLYSYENGSGINTEVTKENGLKLSENAPKEWEVMPTNETYSNANSSGLTVTQTFWGVEFSDKYFGKGTEILNTNTGYWIASRYTYCDDNAAGFGLRAMESNRLYGNYMCYSNGISVGKNNYLLRPVVTLGADIKIEECTGENNTTNMHKIIW